MAVTLSANQAFVAAWIINKPAKLNGEQENMSSQSDPNVFELQIILILLANAILVRCDGNI